jgi:16S rRNA (uracil1498-N3)-methyltransferase
VEPPIFYAPPEYRRDKVIQLPDTESHHAITVMRLSRGASVIVVDGLGTAYRGEIADIAGRKKVEVRIDAEIGNYGEPTVVLTLAAGLSAGYKLDSIIEKGTELGVKRFVPVITEKSKVRLDDSRRAAARTRRLERVALAAIKQCRRSYRPDISLPIGLVEFLRQVDAESVKLIFHPGDASESLENVPLTSQVKRVTLLVGPESGFTSEEVRSANQAGFITVSLGPRALRTETAGPVACALIMNMLGELR